MSTKPSVQPLPRERAPEAYQLQNEQRYRSQVDDELAQKHDKRSNLVLGRGKSLVLSSPSGVTYSLGLSDTGILTVTDAATGDVATIILDFDQIDGELDADRINFGAQTEFDLTTETFITEVGSVRSRYGTAFGNVASQVVMWHGPTSVAQGSESRTNGYLAIGTDGLIYHNAAALDWGATASAAAAQTSIGTAAAIAGQGWGATAAEAAASNARVGLGVNRVKFSRFEASTTGWTFWINDTGNAASLETISGAPPIVRAIGTAAAAGNLYSLGIASAYYVPVVAGERVCAQAAVGGVNCDLTNTDLLLRFWNSVGGHVGDSVLANAVFRADIGETRHVLATVPAGAVTASVQGFGRSTAAGAFSVVLAEVMISGAHATQTDKPPFEAGPNAFDRADITGANTAAAIAGQGWGATAAEAAASNALVPGSGNAAVDSDFRFTYAFWSNLFSSAGSWTNSSFAVGGKKYLWRYATAPPSGAQAVFGGNPVTAMPVVPGQRVEVSAEVGASGMSSTALTVDYYDAVPAYLTTAIILSNPTNFARSGGFAVAPAGAAFAAPGFIAFATGGVDASLQWTEPLIRPASAAQTALTAYVPGLQAEPGANITGNNTAAAIAGQGWGATAAQFAADNQYPLLRMPSGLARNANFAEPFTGTARPPGWDEWVDGLGTFGALASLSGSGYKTTVPASQIYDGIQQRVPAFAGQNYLLACEARRSSGSFAPAGSYVSWRNASDVEIGIVTLKFGSEANTAGIITTTPDGFNRWEKLLTPPAGTVSAILYAMNAADFFGSVASGTGIEWKLCDLIPLSLVSQLGANVTGLNTAAGFTGQGALATANAGRGSTASRPTSTGGYSFYSNTSTGYLQQDLPSLGWTDIALLNIVSATGARITSAPVYTGADGNRTTSAAALTLTSLTGTITYRWAVTEAGASDIVLGTPGSATCTFRWPSMVGDREVTIQCIITSTEGTFIAPGIARWTSTS